MRNAKPFWVKINFTFAIFFLLFLSVFSVKLSYADTCLRGVPEYLERVVSPVRAQACPNSGLLCTYGIMESRYEPAWCLYGVNIFTTVSRCRIRSGEEAPSPIWNWPRWLGGDTLQGPCFPPVATAPCGSPYEVTIWYQWVYALEPEGACDPSDCFFCQDNIDDIPDCGLLNSRCPD